MRTSIALATLLAAGFAAAQSVPGIPKCAGTCIDGFGSCGGYDVNCICNNKQLIANLACCVSVQCDEADQETTLTFAQGICGSSGADLPSSASCAPGAQSTPVDASSTGSAATSGATSSATTTGGSSAATTSSGGSASSTGSSASASDASASASSTPNAGARNEKVESGLGLGLAVAGLMAAI